MPIRTAEDILAKYGRIGRPPARQAGREDFLSEEDRRGLMGEIGHGSLSAVAYAGNLLDKYTASRALRGVLGGKPRELLSIIPGSDVFGLTRPEDVVSGKEVLRIRDDPTKWSDDLLGFGAELLLDPTLPFTGWLKGGLTATGKLAKKAGVLDTLVDKAIIAGGPGMRGPRSIKGMKLEELVRLEPSKIARKDIWDRLASQFGPLDTKIERAGAYSKLRAHLDKPLGASLEVGVPAGLGPTFGSFNIPGERYRSAVFDELGRALTTGVKKEEVLASRLGQRVPSYVATPAANILHALTWGPSRVSRLFDQAGGQASTPKSRAQYREAGREIQAGHTKEAAQIIKLAREIDDSVKLRQDLDKKLEKLKSRFAETAPGKSTLGPKEIEKRLQEIRVAQGLPFDYSTKEGIIQLHRQFEGITPADPMFSGILAVVKSSMRREWERLREMGAARGELTELTEKNLSGALAKELDVIRDFSPRRAKTLETGTFRGAGEPTDKVDTMWASRLMRTEEATRVRGGTGSIEDILANEELTKIRKRHQKLKGRRGNTTADRVEEIFNHLKMNYGTGGRAGKPYLTLKDDAEIEKFAEWIESLPLEVHKEGMYISPIDAQFAYMKHLVDNREFANMVFNMMAHAVKTGGSEGKSMRKVMERARLLQGDWRGGAMKELVERVGGERWNAMRRMIREINDPNGKFAGWASDKKIFTKAKNRWNKFINKEIKIDNYYLPDEIFDDIAYIEKVFKAPKQVSKIIKALDTSLNIFRFGMLTHPARYNRDLVSGQVQNMMHNQWSFWSVEAAHNLLRGDLKKVAERNPEKIIRIQQTLARAGMWPRRELDITGTPRGPGPGEVPPAPGAGPTPTSAGPTPTGAGPTPTVHGGPEYVRNIGLEYFQGLNPEEVEPIWRHWTKNPEGIAPGKSQMIREILDATQEIQDTLGNSQMAREILDARSAARVDPSARPPEAPTPGAPLTEEYVKNLNAKEVEKIWRERFNIPSGTIAPARSQMVREILDAESAARAEVPTPRDPESAAVDWSQEKRKKSELGDGWYYGGVFIEDVHSQLTNLQRKGVTRWRVSGRQGEDFDVATFRTLAQAQEYVKKEYEHLRPKPSTPGTEADTLGQRTTPDAPVKKTATAPEATAPEAPTPRADEVPEGLVKEGQYYYETFPDGTIDTSPGPISRVEIEGEYRYLTSMYVEGLGQQWYEWGQDPLKLERLLPSTRKELVEVLKKKTATTPEAPTPEAPTAPRPPNVRITPVVAEELRRALNEPDVLADDVSREFLTEILGRIQRQREAAAPEVQQKLQNKQVEINAAQEKLDDAVVRGRLLPKKISEAEKAFGDAYELYLTKVPDSKGRRGAKAAGRGGGKKAEPSFLNEIKRATDEDSLRNLYLTDEKKLRKVHGPQRRKVIEEAVRILKMKDELKLNAEDVKSLGEDLAKKTKEREDLLPRYDRSKRGEEIYMDPEQADALITLIKHWQNPPVSEITGEVVKPVTRARGGKGPAVVNAMNRLQDQLEGLARREGDPGMPPSVSDLEEQIKNIEKLQLVLRPEHAGGLQEQLTAARNELEILRSGVKVVDSDEFSSISWVHNQYDKDLIQPLLDSGVLKDEDAGALRAIFATSRLGGREATPSFRKHLEERMQTVEGLAEVAEQGGYDHLLRGERSRVIPELHGREGELWVPLNRLDLGDEYRASLGVTKIIKGVEHARVGGTYRGRGGGNAARVEVAAGSNESAVVHVIIHEMGHHFWRSGRRDYPATHFKAKEEFLELVASGDAYKYLAAKFPERAARKEVMWKSTDEVEEIFADVLAASLISRKLPTGKLGRVMSRITDAMKYMLDVARTISGLPPNVEKRLDHIADFLADFRKTYKAPDVPLRKTYTGPWYAREGIPFRPARPDDPSWALVEGPRAFEKSAYREGSRSIHDTSERLDALSWRSSNRPPPAPPRAAEAPKLAPSIQPGAGRAGEPPVRTGTAPQPSGRWLPNLDPSEVTTESIKYLQNHIAASELTGVNAWEELAIGPQQTATQVMSRIPGESPVGYGVALKALRPRFMGGEHPWLPNFFGGEGKIRGAFGAEDTTIAPGVAGNILSAYTDGVNRIAPYFDQLAKGVHPSAARGKVMATQVDYSSKALTPFEQEWMTRTFAFYRFTKGMLPFTVMELLDRPSGMTAQAVRFPSRGRMKERAVPEDIAQTLAIPMPGAPKGFQKYLTGLGLMHEDPLKLLRMGPTPMATIRGVGSEMLGRMRPGIKAPLEVFSGRQFYTGREMADLEGNLGRLISNLGITKHPVKAPPLVEQVASNSAIARYLANATQLSRMLPGAGAGQRDPATVAINLLTGIRTRDVDVEKASNRAAREVLETLLRGRAGVRTLRPHLYFRDEDWARLSPKMQQYALLYKQLALEAQRAAAEQERLGLK